MVTIPSTFEGGLNYIGNGQAWKSTGIVGVDMSAAAANSFAAVTIPAGSVVTGLALHVPNTISASTATNLSVGTSSDPDKYGEFDLTAGDYEQPQNQWASPLASDEDIVISATDGSGAAAGTIGGGSDDYVQLRVCYYQILPIYGGE